jgi:hypothetical protein
MANHVLLNNVDHKYTRVITTRSAALGDNVMFTPTFHYEFRNLQAHYPIFFRRGPDGRFNAVAVFGFRDGENLFLDAAGWDAHYVPMTIERQPFLIGFQETERDGEQVRRPVIHLDIDSPRVSEAEGEALFLEHGGISDYLKRVDSLLHTIHEGFAADGGFIDALIANHLLESFTLDVELDDKSMFRVVGFHTIHEERLSSLDGVALHELNRKGYLQPAYMVLASLSNIRDLIARKNRRLAKPS